MPKKFLEAGKIVGTHGIRGDLKVQSWCDTPEVLLSGHHANIEAWRREMSLRRTKKDRPDLFAKFEPQDKRDRKILEKIRQDG